jgi:hypothetical protein
VIGSEVLNRPGQDRLKPFLRPVRPSRLVNASDYSLRLVERIACGYSAGVFRALSPAGVIPRECRGQWCPAARDERSLLETPCKSITATPRRVHCIRPRWSVPASLLV